MAHAARPKFGPPLVGAASFALTYWALLGYAYVVVSETFPLSQNTLALPVAACVGLVPATFVGLVMMALLAPWRMETFGDRPPPATEPSRETAAQPVSRTSILSLFVAMAAAAVGYGSLREFGFCFTACGAFEVAWACGLGALVLASRRGLVLAFAALTALSIAAPVYYHAAVFSDIREARLEQLKSDRKPLFGPSP